MSYLEVMASKYKDYSFLDPSHYFHIETDLLEKLIKRTGCQLFVMVADYPCKADVTKEQLDKVIEKAVAKHIGSGSAVKTQANHPDTTLVKLTQ